MSKYELVKKEESMEEVCQGLKAQAWLWPLSLLTFPWRTLIYVAYVTAVMEGEQEEERVEN